MYDIKKEIQEITNKEIFMATHESFGHCLTEHLLNDKELRDKLYMMPRPRDEFDIVMATRFFSEEDALAKIQEGLEKSYKKIVNWRKDLMNPYLELQITFETPVGEGIVKNASFNKMLKVHGLRIILIAGDKLGRSFYIKTAYPMRSINDIDEIYEAIDEWQMKKKR